MPGAERLEQKLHPRTGFMIFFPGSILLVGLLAILFSRRLQEGHAAQGLAATFAIDAAVVLFLVWSNRGHVVAWDESAVYVRQPDEDLLFRRYPYAAVPYTDIRGIKLLPPPRGVPPRFPLLEIVAPTHVSGPPLFIDPNYFRRRSLANFVDEICARVPEMKAGANAKTMNRLTKLFDAEGR
jgi:hypothetical protein